MAGLLAFQVSCPWDHGCRSRLGPHKLQGHAVAGRRQYLVENFPVLSAGPTPSIDLEDWELVITSETDEQRRWD